MREIKFRAWDKKQKAMIDPFYLVDDIFTAKKHLFFPSTSGGIDFQQYVGIKDKNSVEIYEGDIVLFQDDWTDENRIFTFQWRSSGFWLWDILQDDWSNSVSRDKDDYEVIGNIYENPELLEPQNGTL